MAEYVQERVRFAQSLEVGNVDLVVARSCRNGWRGDGALKSDSWMTVIEGDRKNMTTWKTLAGATSWCRVPSVLIVGVREVTRVRPT